MSFKRFFQLFLFYFLSILVAYGLIAFLAVDNFWLVVCLMTIVGYLTLGIPLTLLSFKEEKIRQQTKTPATSLRSWCLSTLMRLS
ncbi:hypothetical protein [Enterococcus sp. AZ051]|uniref:hypothetical protein n=1 Tax=Enterococcus sp. AZ051 TaxID=2774698 RepID=UPI003D2DF34E